MHSIRIYNSHTSVALLGPLAAPPFGTTRLADGGPEDTRLELALSGSPAEIDAGLTALGRALESPAWLELTLQEGGEPWRTPLQGWALRTPAEGPLDRHLRLTRAAYWEGSLRVLPLNGSVNAVTLINQPGGNSVTLQGVDCAGDLPAPLHLEIGVPLTESSPLAHVLLSLSAGSDAPVLQAEDAFSPVVTSLRSDPTCSGGACRSVSWSGDAETAVARWNLNSTALSACAGRTFRPLLRLTGLNQQDGLDLRLRLSYPGVALPDETPAMRARLNSACIELPPIYLPPCTFETAPPGALEIWLLAQRIGGAALELDDLLLLPAANVRSLRAALSLPPGWTLVDDGEQACALNLQGEALASHNPGGLLALTPGRDQRLTVVALDSPPGMNLTLRAFYRPRRSLL